MGSWSRKVKTAKVAPHIDPKVAKVEDAFRRSRPGGEIRGVKGEHVFYATLG